MMHDWHDWHHWLYLLNPFHGVFTLLFGTAAVLVRKLRQTRRESRAATWPTVDAVIQASRLVHGNGYQVQVDYCYYAQAESRYGSYRRHLRAKRAAETFATAIRTFKAPARYSIEDPNRSVLVERDLSEAGRMAGSRQVD